jgi:hypothetical protein
MPNIAASPKTENTRAKALLFPTVLLPWHEKAFHKNILPEYSASLLVSQLPIMMKNERREEDGFRSNR